MSRTKLILLLCLALWGCADMQHFNRGAESAFQVANLVDMAQTLHGPGDDSCYRENEPLTRLLIGSQPSSTAIVAHGVAYGLIHYGVTHWLESHGHEYWAAAWEAVTIADTGTAVAHNYTIGIRLGAPNTDQGYSRECVHR